MQTTPHHDDVTSSPAEGARYRTDVEVGEIVRLEMWRQRMPQQRLAEALGVDPAAVSRRLRGEIAWKLSDLNITAKLLGLNVTAFLANTPAQPAPAEVTA